MKKLAVVAALLAFAAAGPAAVAETATGSSEAVPVTKKPMKMKAKKPMKMQEPMNTRMAKEGMKKGDMKAMATKKDAEMHDMMMQEQKQMK